MGLNAAAVRTGDSEDSRWGNNMIPLISGHQESCLHITLHNDTWRRGKRERQPIATALLMVTSKNKCWQTYRQSHYYFSIKAIFPFLLWWGNIPHRDCFWKGMQTRGCNNWNARATGLFLLFLWPGVPEHAQAFTPQYRDMDIWLSIHSCPRDTGSAQALGPQDTSLAEIHPFPRQSCPLRLSEHSAVFYKKLFYNNTEMILKGFPLALCALSARYEWRKSSQMYLLLL